MKEKPLGIPIFSRDVLGGILNVFELLDTYLDLRRRLGNFLDRLLLQVNHAATSQSSFFRR